MNRFFKVELTTLNAIRLQVISVLEQPNDRAAEPWKNNGDFNDGSHGYVALGEHHCIGEFAPLLSQFIDAPGVEEIDEATYRAAMPQTEETL